MIQWLVDTWPAKDPASKRLLFNPESLAELAHRYGSGNGGASELSDQFSLALHDMRMGGTWKRTNRGRLARAEKALCNHLVRGTSGDVTVIDLGASDGVTTLDLLEALERCFGSNNTRVYLTDLNLWLLRYCKGPITEYRAADGEPVLARFGRFALRLSSQRHNMQQGGDPLVRCYLACRALRRSMRFEGKIALVNPQVSQQRGIIVRELNCLVHAPSLVDVASAVRASNVLNRDYFSDVEVNLALTNIHSYLKDAGLFVVSRNVDAAGGEIENGSAWRKEARGFACVEDFGAGSEMRDVVDSWRLG